MLTREIVRRKRVLISQQKKLFDLTRQDIPLTIPRKLVHIFFIYATWLLKLQVSFA